MIKGCSQPTNIAENKFRRLPVLVMIQVEQEPIRILLIVNTLYRERFTLQCCQALNPIYWNICITEIIDLMLLCNTSENYFLEYVHW